MKKSIDAQVDNQGSLWLIRPLSLRANKWLSAHVDSQPWQWLGGALCIDARMATPIVRAMKRARLSVQL